MSRTVTLEHGEDGKPRSYSSRPAYQLEGHYLPLGTGQVLHGYVPVSRLEGGLQTAWSQHHQVSGSSTDLGNLAGVSGRKRAAGGPWS